MTRFKKILLGIIGAGALFFVTSIAYGATPNFWLLTANKIKPLTSTWDLLVGVHSSNPVEVDGSIYYNSVTKVFNCGINGSWQNCATATGSSTGITTLNNQTGATQSFASGTPPTGIDIFINSAANTHTFSLGLQSGYNIPLTASTTQWTGLFNNILTRLAIATSTTGNGITVSTTTNSITLNIPTASASLTGQLSFTDYNTFNNKQPAGNYITALTGDGTASGPGSVALTLATVNSNVGSFGSSTAIPNFTVNGKGLLTAAGTNAVIAPAGTLTGTTLASNVLSSSLTSLGTLGTLTVSGQTTLGNASTTLLSVSSNLNVTGTSTLATTTVTSFTATGIPTFSGVANCNGSTFLQITSGLFGCGTPAGGGSVSGGTTGFVATWASSTGLTSGILRDNGTVAGANATSSTVSFLVQGTGANNAFQVNSSTGSTLLRISPTAFGDALIGPAVAGVPFINLTNANNAGLPNYAFNASQTTGMYSPTTNQIGFSTNGVGRMAINDTGVVGIGTVTPTTTQSALLQIDNSTFARVLLTASTSPNQVVGFFDVRSDASVQRFQFGSKTAHSVNFFTSDASRLGIWPTGGLAYGTTYSFTNDPGANTAIFQTKLGINTTSPGSTLSVQATSGQTIPILTVASSSNTSFFSISSAGLIGAGTTTAPGLLTLQGSSGSTNDLFDVASSTGINIFQVLNSTQSVLSVGTTSTASNLIVQGNSSFNAQPLLILASSTGTTLLKVDSAGHLGYGGTAPTLTSCNTGTVLPNSTDVAGAIIPGSAQTTCTITFATPRTNTPFCQVTEEAGTAISIEASATPTTLVITGTTIGGDTIAYHCDGN